MSIQPSKVSDPLQAHFSSHPQKNIAPDSQQDDKKAKIPLIKPEEKPSAVKMKNHHLQKFSAIFETEDDWLEFASSEYLARELVDNKVYSYFESDRSRHVFFEFEGGPKHSKSVETRIFEKPRDLLKPLNGNFQTLILQHKCEAIDLKEWQDKNANLIVSLRSKKKETIMASDCVQESDVTNNGQKETVMASDCVQESDVTNNGQKETVMASDCVQGSEVTNNGQKETVMASDCVQEDGVVNNEEEDDVNSDGCMDVDPADDPGQNPKLLLFYQIYARDMIEKMQRNGGKQENAMNFYFYFY